MSLMTLLAFVLSTLAVTITGKLSEHIIQIAEEFADQLVVAINLSGFVRPFVWLGAAVLAILFVIVPLAWLGRLIMPELNTKTA